MSNVDQTFGRARRVGESELPRKLNRSAASCRLLGGHSGSHCGAGGGGGGHRIPVPGRAIELGGARVCDHLPGTPADTPQAGGDAPRSSGERAVGRGSALVSFFGALGVLAVVAPGRVRDKSRRYAGATAASLPVFVRFSRFASDL